MTIETRIYTLVHVFTDWSYTMPDIDHLTSEANKNVASFSGGSESTLGDFGLND